MHHPQVRSLGRLFLEYEFQTDFCSYTLEPVQTGSQALRYSVGDIISRESRQLTLNLPTTTIVAQPSNIIKWQLKFNPVA